MPIGLYHYLQQSKLRDQQIHTFDNIKPGRPIFPTNYLKPGQTGNYFVKMTD